MSAQSHWTQCKIVNAVLGRTDCCDAGAISECNKPWYIGRALTCVGHLAGEVRSAIPVAGIEEQIATGVPIAAQITWKGGGAHITVISGVETVGGASYLRVADPAGAIVSTVAYDEFKNSYKQLGFWNHTYLLRK